jgi:hypothetical protein
MIKHSNHFAEVARTSSGVEDPRLNPTTIPIPIRALDPHLAEGSFLEPRTLQVDLNGPPGIVQTLDGDAVLMFPISIGVRQVSILQPSQWICVNHRCRTSFNVIP